MSSENAILSIVNNNGVNFWRFRQNNNDIIDMQQSLNIFNNNPTCNFRILKTYDEWNSLHRYINKGSKSIKVDQDSKIIRYFDFSQTHGAVLSTYNYPNSRYIIGAIDTINDGKSTLNYENYFDDMKVVVKTYIEDNINTSNVDILASTVSKAICCILGNQEIEFNTEEAPYIIKADKVVSQIYEEIKEGGIKGYEYRTRDNGLSSRGNRGNYRGNDGNAKGREESNQSSSLEQVGVHGTRHAEIRQRGTMHDFNAREQVASIHNEDRRGVYRDELEIEGTTRTKENGRLVDELAEPRENEQSNRGNDNSRDNRTKSSSRRRRRVEPVEQISFFNDIKSAEEKEAEYSDFLNRVIDEFKLSLTNEELKDNFTMILNDCYLDKTLRNIAVKDNLDNFLLAYEDRIFDIVTNNQEIDRTLYSLLRREPAVLSAFTWLNHDEVFDICKSFEEIKRENLKDEEEKAKEQIKKAEEVSIETSEAEELLINNKQANINESIIESEIIENNKTESEVPHEEVPANNYVITEDTARGGAKTRFNANIEAIKLVKQLNHENRNATKEEQKILARYCGWGGLANAFDERKTDWEKEYNTLKQVLTSKEYEEARASTLSAHYTSNTIIKSIYNALEQFGVKECRMLEPACGIGNFLGALPKSFDKSKTYGVEIDNISGMIAQKLYPESNIQITGFEQTHFDNNSFDTVVTNVPFGNFSVLDKEYIKEKFLIHDYFIAKGIDKVRPNGICAFITSKGTLDKRNSKVREWISKRAELIGAIRLPNTAFQESANTKVTSDILFFKKRSVPLAEAQGDWLDVSKNEDGIFINNYFVKNPQMLLGKMVRDGMYGGENETALIPDERPLNIALEQAVNELPSNIYNTEYNVEDYEKELVRLNRKNFSYYVENNEVKQYVDLEIIDTGFTGKKKNRAIGLITIKEQVRNIIDLMLANCSDEELQEAQSILNEEYDKYVKEFGYLNNKNNQHIIDDDPEFNLLMTIESYDRTKDEATKEKIFTHRTIRHYEPITHTDDVKEALAIVMSEYGRVDLKEIEKLTDKDFEEITTTLNEVIYRNPKAELLQLDKYEGWETAEEYLSGNVKAKLKLAEEVARDNENYQHNVESLREVIPADIPPQNIAVRLGTSWIDTKYYKQFVKELLDGNRNFDYYTSVDYNGLNGEWSLKECNYYVDDEKNYGVYGTQKQSATTLIEKLLNQRQIKVMDTVYDEYGNEKKVLNKQETILATQKAKEIDMKFRDWIFEDDLRRETLAKKYNDMFNNSVVPKFDGSYLTYPDMSEEIKLLPHQTNAVHRVISSGNTLLHHCVGAGKTYTICATAMKLKQLGLANKPLIVVPNHLTKQWTQEFLKIYPTANVLMTTDRDRQKKNRQQFVSRVATGDWDAIIMPQSFFQSIPVSDERKERLIRQKIEDLSLMLGQNQDKYSVKQIETQKKKEEAKLKKLLENDKKDNVLNFEELGVDYLFVDEAHYYKNRYVSTKINNVRGINSKESQRATDMDEKCDYLKELHGGEKGIVFATGTPISNSMTEMFVMQSYLADDELRERGIEYFDNWVADFGRIETSAELDVSGKRMKSITRLGKFVNIPELMTIYKKFADVKTAEDLKLPVPEAETFTIKCTPTTYQDKFTKEIVERGERINNGSADSREDNMLKLTTDGKLNSVDARLYSREAQDEPNSKVNVVAEQIFEIYQKTRDIKGTQMVFCDTGTPKCKFEDYVEGVDFDIYNELKCKLVKLGIPANEIRYIHEAGTNDNKKQEIFNLTRNGDISVLLGSTSKCGCGANIQNHLVALHHFDTPYKPSDLEQRNGRIVRQGNMNKKVGIYTYVTERTFDSYSYQILENKQKFIAQINNSSNVIREADDIDEGTMNFATLKAIGTGNPKFIRQLELTKEVKELEILRKGWQGTQIRLKDKIHKTLPDNIKDSEKRIQALEEDIALVKENKTKDFSCTIMNKHFDKRADAGKFLQTIYKTAGEGECLGSIYGLDIMKDREKVSINQNEKEYNVKLVGTGTYTLDIGTSETGCITRLENRIAGMENNLTQHQNKLEKYQAELKTAQEEILKKFDKDDEYNEKRKELDELEIELSLDKEDINVVDEEEELNFDMQQENEESADAVFDKASEEKAEKNTPITSEINESDKLNEDNSKILQEPILEPKGAISSEAVEYVSNLRNNKIIQEAEIEKEL